MAAAAARGARLRAGGAAPSCTSGGARRSRAARRRVNLVKAMITGDKPPRRDAGDEPGAQIALHPSRATRGYRRCARDRDAVVIGAVIVLRAGALAHSWQAAPIMVEPGSPQPGRMRRPIETPPNAQAESVKPQRSRPSRCPGSPPGGGARRRSPILPAPPPPTPEPVALAPGRRSPSPPPIFAAGLLDSPPPAYPPCRDASASRVASCCACWSIRNGGADDVRSAARAAFPRLDDVGARDGASLDASSRPSAATEPVPAWVLIPISFRLEG